MFQCAYPRGNTAQENYAMSLFDPNSHALLQQLREEQLQHRARLHHQLAGIPGPSRSRERLAALRRFLRLGPATRAETAAPAAVPSIRRRQAP